MLLLKKAEKMQSTVDSIVYYLNCLGGVGIFIVMVLILLDVSGRYLMSRPLPGVLEWSQLMLVFIIYMPLAFVEAQGGHITITFLQSRLSKVWRTRSDFAIKVLGLCVFSFLAFLTFNATVEAFRDKEVAFGDFRLYLWIPKASIFVGCLLYSIRLLSDVVLGCVKHLERGDR
ncbi:MAG: TRAP transporter small permease [Syntrophales bacterium]|jgi:TRAP-type C4-dicarboxylate transport system permease small subunit|nr:TRAP transporter small permease [Syntrophales bacterium]